MSIEQKAARWDFIMSIMNNEEGPEAKAMEHVCEELEEDFKGDSEQFGAVVDEAIKIVKASK